MKAVNWLRSKWVESIAYWAAVVGLMYTDGDLGWDDFVIFWLALVGWWKLILK